MTWRSFFALIENRLARKLSRIERNGRTFGVHEISLAYIWYFLPIGPKMSFILGSFHAIAALHSTTLAIVTTLSNHTFSEISV